MSIIHLEAGDDCLSGLLGASIASAVQPGVRYQVARRLATGGMSCVFLAIRSAPEGQGPVVLKVMRPSLALGAGPEAAKVVLKESVALQRLNEMVPTPPFVVRLIESGSSWFKKSDRVFELPWFALEYVHGGAAGTTLTERVATSIRETGYALDTSRAVRAIHCLSQAVATVHEAGIIHRDIKPDNVLCCGSGDDELFKLADFGVARASGVSATFYGGALGTLGYAPPELIDGDAGKVGPWTDVFSLAAVVYFLLTGEEYFSARSLAEAMALMLSPGRPKLADAAQLCPELRERESSCKTIDLILAQATSRTPVQRPQSGVALAASLLPWLRTESWRLRKPARPTTSLIPNTLKGWRWTARHAPLHEEVVRSAAWDADGTCLVATTRGLRFWDGTSMRDAPADGLPSPASVRFVTRLGLGRWLVACEGSVFAIYEQGGVREVMRSPQDSLQLDLFCGALGDLAVGVAQTPEGPNLVSLAGRHWLKPMPVADAASILAIARVTDTEWLLAGRRLGGGGYAALFYPLEWEVQPISNAPVRAMLACAADSQSQVAVIGGADGAVVTYEQGVVTPGFLPDRFDVSAVAVDATGATWAAGAGKLALRSGSSEGASWEILWEDASASAPIVSLFADNGLLLAMAADGGIIEGRVESLPVLE